MPFASGNDGVMHACGHDGHTSGLLGAMLLLAQELELPVPVKLIFQPAEETGNGAKALIAAGVLDDVAMIFGGISIAAILWDRSSLRMARLTLPQTVLLST